MMIKGYKNKKAESEYWKSYNEREARKLLSFVKEIMGETVFYGTAVRPLDKVSFLLEHLEEELLYTLSFYFDDHMIDERGLVLTLLQILSKYPYGKGTSSMIDAYQKLSFIKEVIPKNHGFEIKTNSGNIVVYRALEMLGQRRIALKNYQVIRTSDVELRMALLHSSFADDTVISCFMPRIFGGVSYEYYIKLINEKGYLDLRHNCFYPSDMFEQYFEPKILMRRKGKNLKTDIPPLFQK